MTEPAKHRRFTNAPQPQIRQLHDPDQVMAAAPWFGLGVLTLGG
jgi:hypothetical protein